MIKNTDWMQSEEVKEMFFDNFLYLSSRKDCLTILRLNNLLPSQFDGSTEQKGIWAKAFADCEFDVLPEKLVSAGVASMFAGNDDDLICAIIELGVEKIPTQLIFHVINVFSIQSKLFEGVEKDFPTCPYCGFSNLEYFSAVGQVGHQEMEADWSVCNDCGEGF